MFRLEIVGGFFGITAERSAAMGPMAVIFPVVITVVFAVVIFLIVFLVLKGVFIDNPKRKRRYSDGSVENDLYQKLSERAGTIKFSEKSLFASSTITTVGFRTFFSTNEYNRYNTFYVDGESLPAAIAQWEYYKIWMRFDGVIMCLMDKTKLTCKIEKKTMKVFVGTREVGFADFKNNIISSNFFPTMNIKAPRGFKVMGADDVFWDVCVGEQKVARVMCWSKNLLSVPESEIFVEFLAPMREEQKAVIIGLALYARLRKYIMALDLRTNNNVHMHH